MRSNPGLKLANAFGVTPLWVSEARRRYQAYLEGDIEAHPGDEVMTRVRNQLE